MWVLTAFQEWLYFCIAPQTIKQTVSNLFKHALNNFSTPWRIRTDKGGENIRICGRMTEVRGENHGSYVAGTSVHNQRIER